MGFTAFPPATTATTAPPDDELPAAAAGPASGAEAPACRQLPFPRLVAAEGGAATDVMAKDETRPPEEREIPAGGDAAPAPSSAAAKEEEDRMDLLWEDFNEELGLPQAARRRGRARRGGGGSWRGDGMVAAAEGSWPSSPSEAGSEPAAGRGGCGPVLRPSSRAGGGARQCRRRAGTWVLLMRIFRRLFVVEKTISSSAAVARQRSSTGAR